MDHSRFARTDHVVIQPRVCANSFDIMCSIYTMCKMKSALNFSKEVGGLVCMCRIRSVIQHRHFFAF